MRSSPLWCLAGISSPRVGAFVTPEPRAARRRPRAAGNFHDAGFRVAPTIAADAPSSSSFTAVKAKGNLKVDGGERSNNIVDDVWTSNRSIDTTTEGDGPIELQDSSVDSTKWILLGGTALILAAAAALAVTMKNDLGLDLELGQIRNDPSASIDMVLQALETMDPLKGMAYFVAFYILAEILAIPAFPLTASSGYLFGVWNGTASCLLGAAIAASVSFVIGKTILRGYVERVLEDNPKFQSIDRAIEREGFKLMLLLRLSPLFPFALSNYLYGASSIRFVPYFFGTLLGFAPGTFAYVYAGEIGKALTIDSATSEPWYVYAGGMAVVVALVKIVGDVASGVIEAMEEVDDGGGWEGDMDIR